MEVEKASSCKLTLSGPRRSCLLSYPSLSDATKVFTKVGYRWLVGE